MRYPVHYALYVFPTEFMWFLVIDAHMKGNLAECTLLSLLISLPLRSDMLITEQFDVSRHTEMGYFQCNESGTVSSTFM